MILKGLQQKKRLQNWMLPIVLVATLLILLIIKFASIPNDFTNTANFKKEVIICGMEKTKGDFFIKNGFQFNGAATQSSVYKRSGKYASLLDSTHQYGVSYEFKNPTPGQTYLVEVWRYTKGQPHGFLAASAKNPEDFYVSTDRSIYTDGNWWQKIQMTFTVPKHKKLKSLSVYVYKDKGKEDVWFDDLSIRSLSALEGIDDKPFVAENFHIQIDKKGIDKLSAIKKRSFSRGILENTDDSWIKSKVTTNNGIKPAKVRLKGDWLDHIFKGKSSFRVQLKSVDSWNGMQTFSVQSPATRGFLREWVYHQMLEYTGVLSPRYDFMHFHYNDEPPLVYAYEEHFTKNLVENQLRREGPIIKFTEDRFWEGVGRSSQNNLGLPSYRNKEKAYWGAEIKPFKEGKTQKNPTLAQSFKIAQNMAMQYQYGLVQPSDIFDIDLLAKYMAVTDILQADHSLTWHNQRFYYNPITTLFEPIGFDGYGEASPDDINAPLFVEKVFNEQHGNTEPIYRIFHDKTFIAAFVKYLNAYTQPDFIAQFLAEIEESLITREAFLQNDYPDYRYNRDNVLKRATKIQEKILPFTNSLQVFQKSVKGDSVELQLKNAHILPLEVVYVGKNTVRGGNINQQTTWVFPNPHGEIPYYTSITAPKWADKVHYRLAGIDSTYFATIPVWDTPESWSPRQELLTQKTNNKGIYKEEGDLIIFEKKTYQIKQPLIIPANKKVIVQPGTQFKISGSGFILSFSSVDMRGDKDEPIIVESTDGKSGAFIVMQAKNPSKLRYVEFRNQNTLAYKGWNLTGAVTFYESEVEVMGCQFIDNQCEDGLNIVRSEFKVIDCYFENIYSDAFDADFCKGTVELCDFKDVANDALDFSTSFIHISNCNMDNIGDKAISAGEHATITAKKINVNRANIGFASKDLSILTLEDIVLKNSSKGFTAYQKKPEYGAATINLKKYQMEKVKFPFLIEGSSVLNK